jgi:hypothetical protein
MGEQLSLALGAVGTSAGASVADPNALIRSLPIDKISSFLRKSGPHTNTTSALSALGDGEFNLVAAAAARLSNESANTNAETIWKIGAGGGAFVTGSGLLSQTFASVPSAGSTESDLIATAIVHSVPVIVGIAIFTITTVGALIQNHFKNKMAGNAAAWSSILERVAKSRT